MKKCPYCSEEIKKEAKKCRYCGEFLEGDINEKNDPDYICGNCKQPILEYNKKCPNCGLHLQRSKRRYKKDNSILKNWDQLSIGEKKYISKKLSGWRILTVFLTQRGLIRCKRWGDLSWYLAIGLILGLTAPPLGFLFCIIARIIVLSNFSKEAYNHDKPYFQKYLNEYAKSHNKS